MGQKLPLTLSINEIVSALGAWSGLAVVATTLIDGCHVIK